MNTEYKRYIRVIGEDVDTTRKGTILEGEEPEICNPIDEFLLKPILFIEHNEFSLDEETHPTSELQVYKVNWKGPHTPIAKWHTVRTLLSPITREQLIKEIKRLLNNKRHFGFCIKCKKYVIDGYMHSKDHCQTCAQIHLGICN